MGGQFDGYKVLEYNLTSQTFITLPELKISRWYHACTLVMNSTFKGILVSGGALYSAPYVVESSELYDLSTKTSSMVGNLNIPRWSHIMMVLGEKIVAMGGFNATEAVEEFDLGTLTWRFARYNLSTERWYSQATAIPGPINTCCDCSV